MQSILMVDDNDQIRRILHPMLNLWMKKHHLDMHISEACNGAEALAWVNENGKPNLLLLDVRMPVMGGAEFLRQSAQAGYDLRPCTLLLTGYADDLEGHLGREALLMQHLRKPFMLPELFAALDNVMHINSPS